MGVNSEHTLSGQSHFSVLFLYSLLTLHGYLFYYCISLETETVIETVVVITLKKKCKHPGYPDSVNIYHTSLRLNYNLKQRGHNKH